MIKSDIRDYVKIYKNFLDKKFCKEILNHIKNIEWQTHSFYEYGNNRFVQHNNELSIAYPELEIKKQLNEKLWYAIERYILKDFKDFDKWFAGWNGYTEVRFNRYNPDTQMKEHCDHIHSMFDGKIKGIPTLSIVGCLNEDYEGGDFVMWETEKLEIPEGAIMLFPSNFMYPHRVDPVTKGTRYSYVSWVY